MSVLSHLQNTVTSVKITETERGLIDTSINTLSTKLGKYFAGNIESKFVFGSYDRRTILRRSKDKSSDVDFMIVFKDGASMKPQTLMTRLKTFAESNYSKKEIYQSAPTIVLELNHIKFEIAPAYKSYFGSLYIPAPASHYVDWIVTNPSKFKSDLNLKHSSNKYLIRDLILVLKYWNVQNDKVYSSYDLEYYIVNRLYFSCDNLKDYFYSAVESLPTYNLSIQKKFRVALLKLSVSTAKKNEQQGFPYAAELEIRKVI